MVAKSFQSFEKLSEPYEKNGKMYISLRNPATGTVREARWYPDPIVVDYKQALGFSEGPIYLPTSGTETEHIEDRNLRFATSIGWYYPSTIPSTLHLFSTTPLSWEKYLEKRPDLKK